MNIEEIEDRIYDLEYESTTYENTVELASLYIIQDNLLRMENRRVVDGVSKELDDILPAYTKYCEVKRKYQLHELTEEAVTEGLQRVCTEIEELITTIYSGTDMGKERRLLCKMLSKLHNKYCK